MNHHGRSAIAIVVALGFLGISWLLGHRPADWEYVFLMFVVFSSALQDAMDGMNSRLEKVARLLEQSADKIGNLSREVRQEAKDVVREVKQESEYLKSHITAEANLVTYDFKLAIAIEKGEPLPEEPAYPEPMLVESTFVELEPPKVETFDRQRFIAGRVRDVAEALGHGWWDMSLVTTPLRRLYAYFTSRPFIIRWVSKD
jgi:hypothetical protein